MLPIKVNSIIKALLTNADNYVNGSALMLTDDSNVLLISQLMEHILIECLFLHVSETRQMDAQSICMALYAAKGTNIFWARKRSWENVISHRDLGPPKYECNCESFPSIP